MWVTWLSQTQLSSQGLLSNVKRKLKLAALVLKKRPFRAKKMFREIKEEFD